MNRIKEILRKRKDTVWFYIPEIYQDRFKHELVACHAYWKDGSPFELSNSISCTMAVHPDFTIAFISQLAWKMATCDPEIMNRQVVYGDE